MPADPQPTQGLPGLTVHGARCLRANPVHTARLPCNLCSEICPHDAVELDGLRVSEDHCDGCGLCVAQCPTGALDYGRETRDGLGAAWKKVSTGSTFTVGCGALQVGRPDSAVPCLAALHWEISLIALLLGASKVDLRSDQCDSCRLDQAAVPRIGEMVATAADFAKALGLGTVIWTKVDGAPASESVDRHDPAASGRISRRELFASWLRRGRAAGREVGKEATRRLFQMLGERETEEVPTPRYRDLVGALLSGREPAADVVGGVALGTPIVDPNRCEPCPICSRACQPSALRWVKEGGNTSGLQLLPERCTGCGACAPACPESAIEVCAKTAPSEWGRYAMLLATPSGTMCECGKPALNKQLGVCTECFRTKRRLFRG